MYKTERLCLVIAVVAFFAGILVSNCAHATNTDWVAGGFDDSFSTLDSPPEHITMCAALLTRLSGDKPSASYVRSQEEKFLVRMYTCLKVALYAQVLSADVPLVLAIGWHESRFKMEIVSSANAQGPLQVIPTYWCPNRRIKHCDLIEAGVRAVNKLVDKYGLTKMPCHYNSGYKCNKFSRRYARKVLATRERLTHVVYWFAQWDEPLEEY